MATAISAPGKLHILGEHSVVYGYPALLAAVNKRVYISSLDTKQYVINSDAQKKLDEYISVCVKNAYAFFKKSVPQGTFLSVNSIIPNGAGMGSSAAIAVAIAAYISQQIKGRLDKEAINSIAFESEVFMHGNPSGGDNTTSTYGGIICYTKNEFKNDKPVSLLVSPKIKNTFFIINTGQPKYTTKDMVLFVQKQREKNQDTIEKIFKEQGTLVTTLTTALTNGFVENIHASIQQGERNLEKIGVVSPRVQELIRSIEKEEGSAKICGAGAIEGPTGIILVFHEDEERLQALCRTVGVTYESIILGEEGVRVEG